MAQTKPRKAAGPPSKKKGALPPGPPAPTWDERLVDSVIAWRREIAGILLFLLAMVTLLALVGLNESGWLNIASRLLRQGFGWGAFIVVLLVAAAGIHLALSRTERPYRVHPSQVLGFEIILITLLALTHLIAGYDLPDAWSGKGGGLVGWGLSAPVIDLLGGFLTALLYLGLLAAGVMLLTRTRRDHVRRALAGVSHRLSSFADEIDTPLPSPASAPRGASRAAAPAVTRAAVEPEPFIVEEEETELDLPRRDKRLPAYEVLEKGQPMGLSAAEIDWKSRRIEETLSDFGLPAKVVEVRRGPTVTQFGVEPGYVERPGPDGETRQAKVRVNQIAALQRDLTLALAVSRLRIEAPVPGRSVVGIEVPNSESSPVRLRGIIESPAYTKLKSPLAVGLGRDVSGAPVAVDLAKLPHLLVAGTTGSGKSVLINAFLTCLVFNNTPEKLKLILIDPKKVEFIRFNGLPHLIGKVEVEADRAIGVLRWLTAEMDRRYELFSLLGARNLAAYNRKVGSKGDKVHQRLPMIGVFIDELADLMHMYPGDVERNLCRLAQMARATGIHLIVATQRPSTDVITGLIKANFPARLSFAVASGTDSRVILDSVGAEHLLGKGDMLFQAPEASGPLRIQGVYVTDTEIERVVNHWRQAMPDHVPGEAPWESLIAKYALLDETDSLLEAAIDLAKKNDQISVSLLQRRLRLGYPRAARLMEHLYEMGIVEDPKTGGKTRKTFVDDDDDPIERYISERE